MKEDDETIVMSSYGHVVHRWLHRTGKELGGLRAIVLMEPQYGDHILHLHLYPEIPKEHERPDIESQQAFLNISSEICHNL
jgi:hypothetical protein